MTSRSWLVVRWSQWIRSYLFEYVKGMLYSFVCSPSTSRTRYYALRRLKKVLPTADPDGGVVVDMPRTKPGREIHHWRSARMAMIRCKPLNISSTWIWLFSQFHENFALYYSYSSTSRSRFGGWLTFLYDGVLSLCSLAAVSFCRTEKPTFPSASHSWFIRGCLLGLILYVCPLQARLSLTSASHIIF